MEKQVYLWAVKRFDKRVVLVYAENDQQAAEFSQRLGFFAFGETFSYLLDVLETCKPRRVLSVDSKGCFTFADGRRGAVA